MPNLKNHNRFKYGENDNQSSNTYEPLTSSEQNPHKRYRPNSTDGDYDPNISDLSEIMENASSNPESLQIITSLILSNTAIKNLITKSLIPEFDLMKKEISELHQRIDDLEQYSRNDCLKFSGIPEPTKGKGDTDQIALNVINKYILDDTGLQNMQRIAISNSHRLGPRPGTRDPPRDTIVAFVRYRDRALVYSNKRNLKSYNQNPSNSYKILETKRLQPNEPSCTPNSEGVVGID